MSLDDDIRWAEIRLALEAAGGCEPITTPQRLHEWLGRYICRPGGTQTFYVFSHESGHLCVHPKGNPQQVEYWDPTEIPLTVVQG